MKKSIVVMMASLFVSFAGASTLSASSTYLGDAPVAAATVKLEPIETGQGPTGYTTPQKSCGDAPVAAATVDAEPIVVGNNPGG